MEDRIAELENSLIIAFVQGVQWWEFQRTEATLWGSDREIAEREAIKRFKENKLGKLSGVNL